MKVKYWDKNPCRLESLGFALEGRSTLAWDIILRHAYISSIKIEATGEKADFMIADPKDIVTRAFAIADIFFETAQSRNEIRPQNDPLEAYDAGSEIEELKYNGRSWRLPRKDEDIDKRREEIMVSLRERMKRNG